MMKVLMRVLIALFLFSCGQDKTNSTLHHYEDVITSVEKDKSSTKEPTINMLFLGHQIQCFRHELPLEFVRICREDENLSYDSIKQNVVIYGTTFHLNCSGNGFVLMTSAQPDTKQIQKVRDAISRFHGEENYEEWHYSWLPYTDSTKISKNYPVIHLRRVRTEEGGTVIVVN